MDFWKTLLVLLKRWYVALPVFAISIGAAGGVYASMPMHYESTGVIVLTSPSSGPTKAAIGDAGQTNPLLAFESSLAISASIVIQSINTPEVVKEMGADTPDHAFVLTGGAEGGPFISVKTESISEDGSRELAIQVLDRVRAELVKRQEALKAPVSTFIGVDDVVLPTKPEPLRGGKLRAAAAAMVLGLTASLGSVYGFESFKTRRRRNDDDDDLIDDFDDDFDDVEPEPEPVRAPSPPADHTTRVRPVSRPATAVPHPMPARAQGIPAGAHPKDVEPAKPNGVAVAAAPRGGPVRHPVNGNPSNGKPANGKPANGKPQNGSPVNGVPAKGGPVRGDAVRGDAVRGDAVRGDAARGDAARGDAARGDAARGDVVVSGPSNGKPPVRSDAAAGVLPNGKPWPDHEYREPPTLRMKPPQTTPEPPDQRK
jgi:hypothetical protein